MSAQPVERIKRYRAPLEEYLALPEGVRAEYVDGEVLVTPPPRWGHNKVGYRLMRLFEDHLPGVGFGSESGFRTSERRYRVPDVVVVPQDEADDVEWLTQTPLVVVEVLSPSTRSEDTIRKAPEYLAAGVGQYWIVDRQNRTITVLRATDVDGAREWDIALTIDAVNPTGEVQVGDHGTVPLDLGAIMPE